MGRRILEQLHLIMAAGDDLILMHQNSADRHFILFKRLFGLFQRLPHEIDIRPVILEKSSIAENVAFFCRARICFFSASTSVVYFF